VTHVLSIDPRTAQVVETVAEETTATDVDRLCRQAEAVAPVLEARGRSWRAQLLRGCADALEAHRDRIVSLADRETALGSTRLNGELTRSCYQFRLFAEVLEEGSYLEAAIDHAGPTPIGPRPDLRRMLVPIGPVAVFGASNFPMAFSVPGGDTASALAAGSPVIVKAHGSHPATSEACFQALVEALTAVDAPEGTIAIVHGLAAGASLVAHPAIKAVGFTGSLSGGKALVSIINGRPDPIPFYGELSSLNPVIVTPAAAAGRADEIARGLVGSFTLGAGQFCTKPGLVFVPHDDAGDQLIAGMSAAISQVESQLLLNERIAQSYEEGTERLRGQAGVSVAGTGRSGNGQGYEAVPMLLESEAAALTSSLAEECFGPLTVVARYRDDEDLLRALALLPPSLTTTLHTGEDEYELPATLAATLRDRTGRLLYNGFPTGVAVSWAQHHGGPWPSTNSSHTSVGTTAIRRFLRPICYQDAPSALLPEELREEGVLIPRRIDGELVLPRMASRG
jgi:NADP-dependent aldehyde dehydrogenase